MSHRDWQGHRPPSIPGAKVEGRELLGWVSNGEGMETMNELPQPPTVALEALSVDNSQGTSRDSGSPSVN